MIDEKKLIEEIKNECNLNAGGLYEEDIVKIIESQPKISLKIKQAIEFIFGVKSEDVLKEYEEMEF